MKVCSKCGIEKDESEFYKGHGKCKKCVSIKRRMNTISTNKHRSKYDITNNGINIFYLQDNTFVTVDVEDFCRCSSYIWRMSGRYPAAIINKNNITMHRFIMNANKGDIIDHINGDVRDCRKNNLRFVTLEENARNRTKINNNNTSGHRGVYKVGNKWMAGIYRNKKQNWLGTFNSFEDAVLARLNGEI